MGKQRKEHPENNAFVNKPFIEEFSEWVDSPAGGLWTEICDALEDLLKDVQLDQATPIHLARCGPARS